MRSCEDKQLILGGNMLIGVLSFAVSFSLPQSLQWKNPHLIFSHWISAAQNRSMNKQYRLIFFSKTGNGHCFVQNQRSYSQELHYCGFVSEYSARQTSVYLNQAAFILWIIQHYWALLRSGLCRHAAINPAKGFCLVIARCPRWCASLQLPVVIKDRREKASAWKWGDICSPHTDKVAFS